MLSGCKQDVLTEYSKERIARFSILHRCWQPMVIISTGGIAKNMDFVDISPVIYGTGITVENCRFRKSSDDDYVSMLFK